MNPFSWFDAGPGSSLQVVWEDGDRVFCRGVREGADGQRNTVLGLKPSQIRRIRINAAPTANRRFSTVKLRREERHAKASSVSIAFSESA
jgi:hypothetical protein